MSGVYEPSKQADILRSELDGKAWGVTPQYLRVTSKQVTDFVQSGQFGVLKKPSTRSRGGLLIAYIVVSAIDLAETALAGWLQDLFNLADHFVDLRDQMVDLVLGHAQRWREGDNIACTAKQAVLVHKWIELLG